MNEHESEFASSICELLGSDSENAERIWAEFFPRMIRFAKKKLSDIPMRSFDEEDVALSAMNSFFKGNAEGKFNLLTNDDELWRLLATITARKATAQRRKQKALKRDGGATRGESVFMRAGELDSKCVGLAGAADQNQMPDTIDQILASCDELLLKLPDEKLRDTAIMRLQGYNNQEISDELGCSLARTKQRVARVKELWAEFHQDSSTHE